MSATATVQTPSSQKMLFAMAGIGTMCALLIVLTYEGTLPRVKRLKAEALEAAIFNVVPGTTETKTFTLNADNQIVPAENPGQTPAIYAGYSDEGALIGVAIEAEGQGYADKIRILYGYAPETETVIGFYVLETKETPGLGDKIEKDPVFLQNFEALDVSLNDQKSGLDNAVVTVKSGEKSNPWEVDGITGATISSRAIGSIINESADTWAPLIQQNLDVLKQNPEANE